MSVTLQSTGYIRPATADSLYYDVWRQYASGRNTPTTGVMCLQARMRGQQGLRGPGALPMNWNLKQVGRLLDGVRIDDYRKLHKANGDRVKSARERDHCRKKFDHALSDTRTNSPCRFRKYQSMKEVSELTIPMNSGPSRGGSPLYNKRAIILNKIRMRSAPERRESTKPADDTSNDIEKRMTHYNEKYKLISKKKEEVVSVPNARFIDVDKYEVESTSGGQEEDSQTTETKLSLDSKPHQPVTVLKSAPQVLDWRLFINKTVEETDEIQNGDLLTHAGNSRPTSAGSDVSRRSSAEGRKQIKHWVDDISVTSEQKQDMSDASSVKGSDGKQPVPVLPEPPAPTRQKEEVEVESIKISPPTFICPSSEEKSRDYAVRLWITQSSFRGSVKTKPLTNI